MGSQTGSTCVADGANIAWTYRPASGSNTAVLIHGIGNDETSWFGVPERFAAHGWAVLTTDLRGHGRSCRRAPFSVEQMAADVVAVLGDRSIVRPVLIGHSLGALICNAVAAQLPHAARAIVNVDQSLELTGFATALRSLWPQLKSDFQSTIVAIFDAMLPRELPAEIRSALQREYSRMNAQVTLDIWSPLVELDSQAIASLVESTMSGIHVPYLALHGSNPGHDYASWLQQRIPNAEVELWDGALHFPHLLHPDRFVSRVMDFAATAA